MDQNGVKTCKIWRKQGWMQGLETSGDFSAKTQGHIHNYVYKLEGLVAKLPGRIYVQEVGSLQGVMSKIHWTQFRSKDYGALQGVFRKTIIFFPGFETGQGMGCSRWRCPSGPPVLRDTGGSGERGKTKREENGSPGAAYLGQKTTAAARRRG
jgi:hypothetical protein